jgi:hypothetical protein
MTFDPTAAMMNDTCAPQNNGKVPVDVVQKSPLFQNAAMNWNNVNLGNTQYVDAQLRAEFRTLVQNSVLPWHNKFLLTVLDTPAVLKVPAGYWSMDVGKCGNPIGTVDDAFLDNYVKYGVIPAFSNQGVGPTNLPVILTYNVEEEGSLGYHAAYGQPLQVYAVSLFSSALKSSPDIEVLSHELG